MTLTTSERFLRALALDRLAARRQAKDEHTLSLAEAENAEAAPSRRAGREQAQNRLPPFPLLAEYLGRLP